MVLTVGSPTLAAYSLAITVLNGQYVAKRFAEYQYSNVRSVIRVLSGLQQAPLHIANDHGLLASLVVLPQNDAWFLEIIEWLDYEHTWSIAAGASIAWVFTAYVFTVVESFRHILSETMNSNGQGVGSVWLWVSVLSVQRHPKF
jgi:hypothetical protein